jgi:hypothetical protein
MLKEEAEIKENPWKIKEEKVKENVMKGHLEEWTDKEKVTSVQDD